MTKQFSITTVSILHHRQRVPLPRQSGKSEFSPEEDPHVIADCVKYVLRELSSSPVPASCCKALLEACRTERSMRMNVMRSAICETFPEPNRRLLQRILMMMQRVASNKAVNRMSTSAVAACMAPLLLRPLLAGDCELENDFDVGGDGSVQLLQAAAAANHAQTIVITLLEEYDNIFGEGSVTPEPYTDSEDSGSESEEITDDEEDSFDDDDDGDGDGDGDATEDSLADVDEDFEHESSAASSDITENEFHKKISGSQSSGSESPLIDSINTNKNMLSSPPQISTLQHVSMEKTENVSVLCNNDAKLQLLNDSNELLRADPSDTSVVQAFSKPLHGSVSSARRPAVWGRTPGKKNLSMESIDIPFEEEAEIQNLEAIKTDLQNKISKEAKANSLLQDSLERRKHVLHERRLALEKDVARLQEQLKKEIELRASLEAGLRISQQSSSISSIADEKMKAELEEIARAEADVFKLKQKSDNLELQLSQHRQHNSRIRNDVGSQLHPGPNHQSKSKKKQIEVEVLTNAFENSARSKHEFHLDSPDIYKDKSLGSPSLTSKPLYLNQQADAVQNPKATEVSSVAAKADTSMPGKSNSRKSNTRNEEKRSQITTELQNMDKGRNLRQPIQNFGQGRGPEHGQLLHDSKGSHAGKILELENFESTNKSDERKNERGKKVEMHPNLDRGKSESFPTGDKSGSKVTPRTYSR